MNVKKNSLKEKLKNYEFTYVPSPIKKGKDDIEAMSIIQGQYQDFIVTKTGYLLSMIEISGLNLDLLNPEEQADVFDDYNAFLIATLNEGTGKQQYIDRTTTVNLNSYVLYWKKRYLTVKEQQNQLPKEEQVQLTPLLNLIASYVHYYQELMNSKDMTTKQHLLILSQKIKDKTFTSLEFAKQELNEQMRGITKALNDTLNEYDIHANQLSGAEYKQVLQSMINYTGD